MNVERRFVLKGMALSSLAGIAMSSAGISAANSALGTQPQPARPTLVLVSSAAAQAAFLQGVNASPAGKQVKVQRTDLSLDFILGFEKRLRIATPQRIIGLVDDASAALIVDLARSAGAHVQWLGQHHAAAHASHHRLLSGETASGCAPQLGLSLNACGAGFSLTEHRLRGQQPPCARRLPAVTKAPRTNGRPHSATPSPPWAPRTSGKRLWSATGRRC